MLIEKLFGKPKMLEDLPDSQDKRDGEELEKLFTNMVIWLRTFECCPNGSINSLADLLWNLCHYKKIAQALVDWNLISKAMNLPSDSAFAFICEKSGSVETPIILVNKDLVKLFESNVIYYFGGMVFVASQCRDFYYKKLFETSDQRVNFNRTKARSWAYEAEFLITMKYNMPPSLNQPFCLNDYQKHILERYPDGLKSLPVECCYIDDGFKNG